MKYQETLLIYLYYKEKKLGPRIALAVQNYPCNLLVVHRDAEGDSLKIRLGEIERALGTVGLAVPAVCLVPVRMTEAWLLHDEAAIRQAAGRKDGTAPVWLPKLGRIEQENDPKKTLQTALLDASQTRGRRRRKKEGNFSSDRRRVAELLNYLPLRRLPAFKSFEDSLKIALKSLE